MINSRPGGAVYEQLAEMLRDDIRAGRLQPGQRLPSERSLTQQHGVARETVRRAIAVLRAEGILDVHHGHGVLVREQAQLDDVTVPPGSTVTARMPTAEERARFGLADGVPMLSVESPDHTVEVHPADRVRLRFPTP